MPNQSLADLRTTALGLPESERAQLAHDLVASLDGAADADALDRWDAELLRRLAEVNSGTATLLTREEFRGRMQERLNKPRAAPSASSRRPPRKLPKPLPGTNTNNPDTGSHFRRRSSQRWT